MVTEQRVSSEPWLRKIFFSFLAEARKSLGERARKVAATEEKVTCRGKETNEGAIRLVG